MVITVAAVDANGEPANGYSVVDRLTTSVSLSGCSGPSPAAVGNNIYSCDPSEAGANIMLAGPRVAVVRARSVEQGTSSFCLPWRTPCGGPPGNTDAVRAGSR